MNIQHNERTIHQRSFLYNVTFLFTYNMVNDFALQSENIVSFLETISYKAKVVSMPDSAVVFSNGDARGLVSSSAMTFIIGINTYKNFDAFLQEYSSLLTGLLELLNVKNLEQSIIQKVNKFQFGHSQDEHVDKEKAMSAICSTDFLSESDECQSSIDSTYLFAKREFSMGELNDVLSITITAAQQKVSFESFIPSLTELNNNMYSAWRWAVSNAVVQAMDHKK